MNAERRLPMFSVLRGAIGACAGAVTAILLVVLLYGGFIVARWWIEGTSQLQRGYDLRNMCEELAFPFLGCGAVGAATGWATRAPHGRHQIAWTLVLVVVGSIPIMAFLSTIIEPVRRYKSIQHPLFYPSEVLFVSVPPIMVAFILAWHRSRRQVVVSA